MPPRNIKEHNRWSSTFMGVETFGEAYTSAYSRRNGRACQRGSYERRKGDRNKVAAALSATGFSGHSRPAEPSKILGCDIEAIPT